MFFALDELSENNKSKINNDYEIILSQLPPLQPIVAKRHYFETGTQRIYQRFCLVLENVKKTVENVIQLDISKSSAGAFVFLCKSTEDTKQEFDQKLKEISKISFPKAIIFGTSDNYKEFFNYALEIASLKRVKTSVSAIEGDAIAKKELSARLTAYQNLLFNSLFKNFDLIILIEPEKIGKRSNYRSNEILFNLLYKSTAYSSPLFITF